MRRKAARRKGAPRGPLHFDVLGRTPAAVGDLVVLDRLALVERRQPGLLHCGDVDENVLAPGRRLDEAIALGRVEPLDRTLSHTLPPRDQSSSSLRSPHAVRPGIREYCRCD